MADKNETKKEERRVQYDWMDDRSKKLLTEMREGEMRLAKEIEEYATCKRCKKVVNITEKGDKYRQKKHLQHSSKLPAK